MTDSGQDTGADHAGPSEPAGQVGIEPPPFSVGNAFSMGWGALKARYGLILWATGLYLMVVVAANIALGFSAMFTLLPILDWAAQFLFYPIMWVGLLWVALHVVQGRPAEIGMLFAGFRRYWPIVGAHALVLVIIYGILAAAGLFAGVAMSVLAAWGLMGGGGPGGQASQGVGAGSTGIIIVLVSTVVLAIVPMLLILPRIYFAPLICLDTTERRLGPVQAFKASWRMTGRRGVRGGLVGVYVLLLLIVVACALVLLLPVLFIGVPLAAAVLAAAYWQVSRQHWRTLTHHCRVCDYSLVGVKSGVCPECGTVMADEQRRIVEAM